MILSELFIDYEEQDFKNRLDAARKVSPRPRKQKSCEVIETIHNRSSYFLNYHLFIFGYKFLGLVSLPGQSQGILFHPCAVLGWPFEGCDWSNLVHEAHIINFVNLIPFL